MGFSVTRLVASAGGSARWRKAAGYCVVGGGLLVAVLPAANEAIAKQGLKSRREALGGIAIGPAFEADRYFYVGDYALEASDEAICAGHRCESFEVQVGVGYGDGVAYWQDTSDAFYNPYTGRSRMLMGTPGSGAFVVAVGPLRDDDAVAAGDARESIVYIHGAPYAVVAREEIGGLPGKTRREKIDVDFDDTRLGVRGRVDLRHVI